MLYVLCLCLCECVLGGNGTHESELWEVFHAGSAYNWSLVHSHAPNIVPRLGKFITVSWRCWVTALQKIRGSRKSRVQPCPSRCVDALTWMHVTVLTIVGGALTITFCVDHHT